MVLAGFGGFWWVLAGFGGFWGVSVFCFCDLLLRLLGLAGG